MTNRHYVTPILILFASCSPAEPESIQSLQTQNITALCPVIRTTQGDIDSNLAGIVLPHEHLLMDFFYYGAGSLSSPTISGNALHNFATYNSLPGVFNDAPGRTIVEVSTRGLREEHFDAWKCPNTYYSDAEYQPCKDRASFHGLLANREYPRLLDDIAKSSGANVVMSTGYYREYYHPPYMYSRNSDGSVTYTMTWQQMAARMVLDIQQGVDGTPIRAGVIGEIGISEFFSHPEAARKPQDLDGMFFAAEAVGHAAFEREVLKAACSAHQTTGAALIIHFPPLYPSSLASNHEIYNSAFAVLRAAGCTAFNRIVFSHMVSTADPSVNAELERLAATGVNLAFDIFGTTEPIQHVEDGSAIAFLVQRGYINQLLVSQDIYNPTQQSNVGYTYILENLTKFFKTPHAQTGNFGISRAAKTWLADVNGDGKSDLVAQGGASDYDHGQIFVALSTGTKFDMWTSVSEVRVSDTAKIWFADVNADGKADLVAQGGAPDYDHGQIYVALSTGSGFSMWTSISDVRVSDTAKVWLVDVNGDRQADLVAQGGAPDYDHGQIYVALSNGTGFSMWTSISDVRVSDTAKVWIVDINGDRKADLIAQGGAPDYDHGQIYVALSTGTRFSMWTSVSDVRVSNTAKVWFADVNGDRKADLVAQGGAPDYDHGQIYVGLSTDTGFNMWTSISDVRVSDTAKVWLADVDGDDRSDLVAQGGANDYDHGQIYVGLSNREGSGFEMWSSHSESRLADENGLVWFADIADGKAAEMVFLARHGQDSFDLPQYFSHSIGVSMRDMRQMMVTNTKRVLEMTFPCAPQPVGTAAAAN